MQHFLYFRHIIVWIPRALLLADFRSLLFPLPHLFSLIYRLFSVTHEWFKKAMFAAQHRCMTCKIDVCNTYGIKKLVWVIWFRSKWFKFGVNILNLVWVTWIWIRCEWFEFGVSDLNLVWVIWIWSEWFKFGVSDLNLVWVILIWCEWFEFGVSDLNSVWVIWIRCKWFEFGVSDLNSVWLI